MTTFVYSSVILGPKVMGFFPVIHMHTLGKCIFIGQINDPQHFLLNSDNIIIVIAQWKQYNWNRYSNLKCSANYKKKLCRKFEETNKCKIDNVQQNTLKIEMLANRNCFSIAIGLFRFMYTLRGFDRITTTTKKTKETMLRCSTIGSFVG